MRRLIWLVPGTLAMSFAAPVHASELPTTFLGSWTNNDMGDVEITGIHVGARTYHEPGYNCDIRSVREKDEAGSINRGNVYIVNMTCAGEGEGPPSRGKKVREVWALRRIDGKDVLVTAGAAGPTFPSIHILQRAKE
jgi:hypothetical protein